MNAEERLDVINRDLEGHYDRMADIKDEIETLRGELISLQEDVSELESERDRLSAELVG